MNTSSNQLTKNRAVSDVVGVILAVAIVVILAAVISLFVLDLGRSVQEPAQAGLNVVQDGETGEVTVTLIDPGNTEIVEVVAVGETKTLTSAGQSVTVDSNAEPVIIRGYVEASGTPNLLRKVDSAIPFAQTEAPDNPSNLIANMMVQAHVTHIIPTSLQTFLSFSQ